MNENLSNKKNTRVEVDSFVIWPRCKHEDSGKVKKGLKQDTIEKNSSDVSNVIVGLILCKKSLDQEYQNFKDVIDLFQRLGGFEVDTTTKDLIILVIEGGEGY
jgi:hypothetical protein